MAEYGVFAVDRRIFDHPIFAREPFTEREAWTWLIGEAAWKDRRVRVGRYTANLKRGELAHATRFLAAKWQWSESRARRFLRRLETDAMVTIQATREMTHITICNYDRYQFARRTDDAQTDAPIDAEATQSRRKEKEVKKEITKTRASGEFGVEFGEFWATYPKRVSKQDALKAYIAARRSGVSHETIMHGLTRAVRSDSRFRDHQYIPYPAKWLRSGGYADESNVAPGNLPAQQRSFRDLGIV